MSEKEAEFDFGAEDYFCTEHHIAVQIEEIEQQKSVLVQKIDSLRDDVAALDRRIQELKSQEKA